MKNHQLPLSRSEYEKFQAARRRAIFSVCAILLYAVALALMVNLFKVEPSPAILLVSGFLIIIVSMIQFIRYKCPRCKTTPMTTRTSFGGGEVVIGGYVALRPKKCHKCGVLFEPPTEERGQLQI